MNAHRLISRGALATVAALLAGCGGAGTGNSALPVSSATTQPAQQNQRAGATFTIVIPPKAAQAVSRKPQYVSASMQSAIITLVSVNGTPYTGTAASPATVATNLTPSNPACTTSSGNLVCTVSASAIAGSDMYVIDTYDAVQTSTSPATPAGNLLSLGVTVVPVTAGQTASATLTLNGFAASSAVASSDVHVSGSTATTFSVVGNKPIAFAATTLDAGGNTIIGPGAPTFAVWSTDPHVAIVNNNDGTFTAQVKAWSSTPVPLTVTPSMRYST